MGKCSMVENHRFICTTNTDLNKQQQQKKPASNLEAHIFARYAFCISSYPIFTKTVTTLLGRYHHLHFQMRKQRHRKSNMYTVM